MALQRNFRAAAAFAAITKDSEKIFHNAVISAAVAAGFQPHIHRDGLRLLAKTVQLPPLL